MLALGLLLITNLIDLLNGLFNLLGVKDTVITPFLRRISVYFEEDVLDFQPPSKEQMSMLVGLCEKLTDPQFFGLENVPNDKPFLLIGNHALYAAEYPLLVNRLYQEKNIYLRSAGDFFHKYCPHWLIFRFFGAFDGTRESCQRLMKNGRHLVIFPGGGREVLKRKSDKKYELMWKERIGFVKLAIENGYPIIPFSSYGTEDMIDIMFDVPLTGILGREMYLPIPKPVTPDRVERVYFWFGKPIETSHLKGEENDGTVCKALRDQVKSQVLQGMSFLKEKRETDPYRKRFPSWAKAKQN